MYTELIRQWAKELEPVLVRWRRHLHQHPELGFAEVQTADFVAARLREMGYEVQTDVAGTGVVGMLYGAERGRVVALRADMDALPISERTGLDFASQNPGVMHACGHDVHMTVALGAAAVLQKLKDRFCGGVKIIFQPAEEGPGGARPMLEAGVMTHPQVDAVIGGHVWHDVPVGKIAVQSGPVMAAVDKWELSLYGRGGHGAQPHLCIDTIAVGAQLVTALQQIASRTNNPQDPMVLSVGIFRGGTRDNVIAGEVEMSGTLRTFSAANRERIKELLPKVIAGVCEPFGVRYDLRFATGYDATINDVAVTQSLVHSAQKILGKEHVLTQLEPSMASEDFAFLAQAVPGTFIRLGINDGVKGVYPLHHDAFDVSESVLPTGVMVYAQAIVDLLEQSFLKK